MIMFLELVNLRTAGITINKSTELNINEFNSIFFRDNIEFYGCKLEGKIIGLTSIYIKDNKAIIYGLELSEKFRGYNIGEMFYEKVEEMLKNKEIKIIELNTDNLRLEWWKDLGYEFIRINNYTGEYELKKEL